MFIWEKFEFNAKDLGLSRSLFSGEKTLLEKRLKKT